VLSSGFPGQHASGRVATARTLAPPVTLLAALAHGRKDGRNVKRLAAARVAEQPELLRSSLVPVDEIVELELVELAGIEPVEALPHVLEQHPQLILVIGADGFTCRSSFLSLARSIWLSMPACHDRKGTPTTVQPLPA
jgi:hypothetical protein